MYKIQAVFSDNDIGRDLDRGKRSVKIALLVIGLIAAAAAYAILS